MILNQIKCLNLSIIKNTDESDTYNPTPFSLWFKFI